MKKISEIVLEDKKVLVRCGFDVAIEGEKIVDDSRIVAGLETIKEVLAKNPKMVLLTSHVGRPGGEFKAELSNLPIAKKLSEMLDLEIEIIENLDELAEIKAQENFEKNKIFMLENLRFWEGEKQNDDEFSRKVAENLDVYLNDAFSVSHRAHASIVGFPKFTEEKAMGVLFQKEFENLNKAQESPEKPAVLIIGGAKIETKLPVIENLVDKYDAILVGGLIANQALDQNLDLGEKVFLPVDFAPAGKEDQRLDIGPKTLETFAEKIKSAKTIVWNGPMGKFEDEDCRGGTKSVLLEIASKQEEAFSLLGGGETLSAINQFSSSDKFSYVSMSGGAMLEFLSGKELPGIIALKQ